MGRHAGEFEASDDSPANGVTDRSLSETPYKEERIKVRRLDRIRRVHQTPMSHLADNRPECLASGGKPIFATGPAGPRTPFDDSLIL